MRNRIFRWGIASVTAVALGGSALAQTCEPRSLSGRLSLAHANGSTAVAAFENAGCEWGGVAQLNGTDGLVVSMDDMKGTTGTITGTLVPGGSLFYAKFVGHFLDGGCRRIAGADLEFPASLDSAPKSFPITIPGDARWLAIDGVKSGITNDATIIVHSDGRPCGVGPRKRRQRR